jgi:biotin transporter BioY
VIASLAGFAAGFATWFIGTYVIASFIYRSSTRENPLSERALKIYEVVLCGILFFVSVGVLYVVSRAMWPHD